MRSPVVQAAEPFRASHDADNNDGELAREEEERPSQDELDIARHATHTSHLRDPEKGGAGNGDLELTRTVSTRLSRVASRITTRDIVDPGPPPDGGVKAWTQVGMAFLLVSTTWGYVNSFGRSERL